MILHIYPMRSLPMASLVIQSGSQSLPDAILSAVQYGSITYRNTDALGELLSDASYRKMWDDIVYHDYRDVMSL